QAASILAAEDNALGRKAEDEYPFTCRRILSRGRKDSASRKSLPPAPSLLTAAVSPQAFALKKESAAEREAVFFSSASFRRTISA
ncbi:hypothetical protein, partial [Streptomyces niveiscabiei]